jgi:hypothetical protein
MLAFSENKLDGLKRIIALGVYSQNLIRMIFFLTFFVQVRGGSIVVKNSITDPVFASSNLAAAQPKSKYLR